MQCNKCKNIMNLTSEEIMHNINIQGNLIGTRLVKTHYCRDCGVGLSEFIIPYKLKVLQ